MSRTGDDSTSEMAILGRVVDAGKGPLSRDAARAILDLKFAAADRARMNRLAAKNRSGKLKPAEEIEFSNFIRVGQTLGVLQSKARRSLRSPRKPEADAE